MFSYNLNNENDFLKGVKKENRIFCMILTQNKSLYNNRVKLQYSLSNSLKYI